MKWMNLNDLEYGENITRILQRSAELNKLSADAKVNALTRVLAEIEDAARKANWRLQQLCG